MKQIIFALILIATMGNSKAHLKVSDAKIYYIPSSSGPAAGYMDLKNENSFAVSIKNITSLQFDKVEWHRSEIKNGMATMSKIEKPKFTPNQKIRLAPGGNHLMLFKPKESIDRLSNVEITFEYEDLKKQTISLAIENYANGENNHH